MHAASTGIGSEPRNVEVSSNVNPFATKAKCTCRTSETQLLLTILRKNCTGIVPLFSQFRSIELHQYTDEPERFHSSPIILKQWDYW